MALSTANSFRERVAASSRGGVSRRGVRIPQILQDRSLAAGVEAVGRLYDLQTGGGDLVVEVAGDTIACAHHAPRNAGQLMQRGRAFRVWSEASFGLMGRSPDYINAVVSVLAASEGYFGRREAQYGEHLRNYARWIAERDLCVSHCFAAAPAGRELRVVDENDSGIVVSGSRGIATLAPICDEIISFGAGRRLEAFEDELALGFSVPVDAPGLSLLCGVAPDVAPGAGQSLTARYAEVDAHVVFNAVFVPWERVYFFRDVVTSNDFKDRTSFFEHAGQHVLTRAVAKAELYFSVADALSEALGISQREDTQANLGRMVMRLHVLRAMLQASESNAMLNEFGIFTPASDLTRAAVCFHQEVQGEFQTLLEGIGASILVQDPAETGVRDLVRISRCATDLTLSVGAARQRLFDRYSQGDPDRALRRVYSRMSRNTSLIERVLASAFNDSDPG